MIIQPMIFGIAPFIKTWNQEKDAVSRFLNEVTYINNDQATITVNENITSVTVADTSVATVTYNNNIATITAIGSNDTYTNITITTAAKTYSCGAYVVIYNNIRYISCMKGYPWEPSYKNYNSQGIDIPVNTNSECIIIDGATGGNIVLNSISNTISIFNLTPNVDSYFIEINNNKVINSGILQPTGTCKMINTKTLENLRDIGGWSCDGGTVKYNKIIRGYTLDRINDSQSGDTGYEDYQADKKMLTDLLQIRQEVSLQNVSDVWGNDGTSSYYTSSPLGKNVKYVSYNTDVMYNHLITDTDIRNGELFTDIFTAAINGDTQYIHCAQGADRTGTVLYVIETVLGLSESDKDKDYELTSFSANRFRNKTEWLNLKTAINNLQGDSIQDKVVKWLISNGISLNLINEFRHVMIDGNPIDLTVDLQTYFITKTDKSILSYSNTNNTVYGLSNYNSVITPNYGYVITDITVTMGENDISEVKGIITGDIVPFGQKDIVTNGIYNVSNYATANVAIPGVGTSYLITTTLNKSTSETISTDAIGGKSYSTIINSNTNYNINSIIVTMNNNDITSDCVFYIDQEE